MIADTQLKLQRVTNLLGKSVPAYRQAYSDRTAWLMACLSELAYIRFNPLFRNQDQSERLLENVATLMGTDKKAALLELIEKVAYDHEAEKNLLVKELATLDMTLLETFDNSGTQAILVSCNDFSVLAFRGTEPTSVKDIKADLKAKMTQCETGGRIHTGFKEAFEKVENAIRERLNSDDIKEKPLFITGHSLGGALATVATKKLTHAGGIAACYTFGSPRVADDEWIAAIKSPIYRVVNAADGVTMLPPGAIIMSSVCWVAKRIPYFGDSIRSWLARFGGYLHCGDMRYMTNCKAGAYENVKLLYYVSFAYRIKGFLVNSLSKMKILKDHSIKTYREKLMFVAEKRNLT